MREGELLHRRRAGLLHVVAADRDRVELRHVLRRVLDDVGHDPHARLGRIDVGVADHELLEDVVLDGPGELLRGHALLLAGDDEAGEHRQHRAVHRHRDRHLVERDAVEQDLHVLDRVDRDAGLADVAEHARVVRVVAAVGGEVEGDREALLAGGEVARGRRRSTPRRSRSPRTGGSSRGGSRTWSRAGRAGTGTAPGQRVGALERLEIGRGVERLDAQAVRASRATSVSGSSPRSSSRASSRQARDRPSGVLRHRSRLPSRGRSRDDSPRAAARGHARGSARRPRRARR